MNDPHTERLALLLFILVMLLVGWSNLHTHDDNPNFSDELKEATIRD